VPVPLVMNVPAAEVPKWLGKFPLDPASGSSDNTFSFLMPTHMQCTPPYRTIKLSQYRCANCKQMIENNLAMEQRRPPEYIIEVFADPSSVKDVVRGNSLRPET
jgi:hypothetical protein